MISERKFSNSYASFWTQLLPTADVFVRHMNLANKRFRPPVGSITSDRDKRAIINELGFRLFAARADGLEINGEYKRSLELESRTYIGRLVRDISEMPPLSTKEMEESEHIALALATYFDSQKLNYLVFLPPFKGCGWLEACKGDIINGARLIEVKAGDRPFRITDVRQVLAYLTLNFAAKQYPLSEVAFVNPRTCMCYECEVDSFVERCSGRKAVDIFEDIIEFVSAETNSK